MEKKLQPTSPQSQECTPLTARRPDGHSKKLKKQRSHGSSKGQRPLPPEPGTTRETKLNGYQWLMFKKARLPPTSIRSTFICDIIYDIHLPAPSNRGAIYQP